MFFYLLWALQDSGPRCMPSEPACLSFPTVLFSLPFFLFLANQPGSLQLLCKFGALTQCVTSPSLNMICSFGFDTMSMS